MKKDILISSFDMDVGGVERSLISMLENFDYQDYTIDLMLYRHQGDFLSLIPDKINLLAEVPQLATFRKSIKDIIREKHFKIGISRIIARTNANLLSKINKVPEVGYIQHQLMWKYSLPFLPGMDKEYAVAISYLWPHYYVANKVKAEIKIAWIHTDYSTVNTDVKMDLKMWDRFDYIVSISEACTKAFLSKYPQLKNKITLMENITSPLLVRKMAEQEITELNNENFNILSVGRLCYAKAFDNAVKALRILHDKGYTNIKWYVVGFGADEEMLKKLIKENRLESSFILMGKKTNPFPYIKACDLYAQPSRYEGKAVTVTEAKILGKPILITNYATAQSQVQNGIDGLITDLSLDGIVAGIEKLYHDNELRNKIAGNCFKTDYSNSSELDKLYRLMN